jgi:hypothetical protein
MRLYKTLAAGAACALAETHPSSHTFFFSRNDVAPNSYPIGFEAWRSSLPGWAVMGAVREAEPSTGKEPSREVGAPAKPWPQADAPAYD